MLRICEENLQSFWYWISCVISTSATTSVLVGFDYELHLSTRPTDYMGGLELWEEAEHLLQTCLQQSGTNWSINPGDGAFYGPKIDVIVSDAMHRHHQTATIQLDFQLPQRFNLSYRGPDDKLHTPVMIHSERPLWNPLILYQVCDVRSHFGVI
jgi:threonyl-tRNA synthetase